MVFADAMRPIRSPIHPLHAILLAFVFPLFAGALIADLAYWRTYEIQWSNFAQWLNFAGCVTGGLALIAAIVSVIRSHGDFRRGAMLYALILLAAWAVGVVNAFVHAKDVWAMMPDALMWSALSAGLALVASWLAYSGFRIGKGY